jgi:hypothetical protein
MSATSRYLNVESNLSTNNRSEKMPKALDLPDVYNNFIVEPLEEEDEFRDFYVERPTPIEEIKERIAISRKSEKYLFLGFKGCGKSTELNKLSNEMDRTRFLIVKYSIRDELDVSDFDFRDFFVSMALKIYDIAEKEDIRLNEDIKKDFEEFAIEITHISEKEIEKSKGLGLSFSKIIMGKIGVEVKSREYIRKELEMKISDLIRRLNFLIGEIERKSKKKMLVIVDDLDKLHRQQQAEDFFYKNYHLLLQPNCYIIYTFPIALAFNPFFENVRQNFHEYFVLPQPPVKNKEDDIIKKNFDYYKKIAGRRMDLELIDEDALEHAILSTGKLSEFILVIRDASIITYTTIKEGKRKGQKMIKEDVEAVLEKLRNTYDRTLTREEVEKLIEIHAKKEARDKTVDDDIVRTLLFSLTIVEYETREEGRWCDINPVLSPLLEKWKKNRT